MCPLCFARCEFDCGVTLTHANDWIISVDSSTNPSQFQFNHFEDAEPDDYKASSTVTIAIMIPLILCISLRLNEWDRQPEGPILFKSALKFPREVKEKDGINTSALATVEQCRPEGQSFHGATGGRHDVSIPELKMSTNSL